MTKQFSPPAYVYVYIDRNTDVPIYVGKVSAGNSLDSRINDHRDDYWFDEKSQDIYYTPVESSATADMLETAMINEYIERGVPLTNIAKTTWGTTSKLSKDQFGWIKYDLYNDRMLQINKIKLTSIDNEIRKEEYKLHQLLSKREEIKKQFEVINKILKNLEDEKTG